MNFSHNNMNFSHNILINIDLILKLNLKLCIIN